MRNLIPAAVLVAIVAAMFGGCERKSSGGDDTAQQPPALAAPLAQHGPNWSLLSGLRNPPAAFALSATVPGQLAIGNTVAFTVTSAAGGYLHIVQVDSNDDIAVLLPNAAMRANRIEASRPFVFPPPESGITLRAQPPAGDSLLAFIVTREDVATADLLPGLFSADGATSGLPAQAGGPAPFAVTLYSMTTTAASP